MFKKLAIAVVGVVALLMTSTEAASLKKSQKLAQAQGKEEYAQYKQFFLKLDTNGDGKLDYTEAKNYLVQFLPADKIDGLLRFYAKAVDADKNGSIDADEFARFFAQYPMDQFIASVIRGVDQDSDGAVEFPEGIDAFNLFYSSGPGTKISLETYRKVWDKYSVVPNERFGDAWNELLVEYQKQLSAAK